MKKTFLSLLTLLALTGCATNNVTFNIDEKDLNRNQSLYVMLPENGYYGAKEYKFSGNTVQKNLVRAFQRYSVADVKASSNINSIQESLVEAKQEKIDLLICPEITHWEDRNTPWSGIRDKVGINVRVIDVNTQQVINDADLYGTNNWFTFVNNRPDVLVPDMIQKYTDLLYK